MCEPSNWAMGDLTPEVADDPLEIILTQDLEIERPRKRTLRAQEHAFDMGQKALEFSARAETAERERDETRRVALEEAARLCASNPGSDGAELALAIQGLADG